MVYRKGELSRGAIDRGWPHQVALEARHVRGDNYVKVHMFADRLSVCPRGHSFRRDDVDWVVLCFANEEDARLFASRFGGEMMGPKTRPRWGR